MLLYIYLSSLFSKPINQTHQQEEEQEQQERTQEGNTNIDIDPKAMTYEKVNELNLKDTELCLGLPGRTEEIKEEQEISCVKSNNKRQFEETREEEESTPPTK